MKLLSVEQDAKTKKGSKKGFLTGILYLAPATEASPVNLCPMASAECREACLYGSGMAAVFPSVKRARIEKTLWFLRDQKSFLETLRADIRELMKSATAREMIPAVRLNGTSDIPKLALAMAKEFPEVQFYDYTKLPGSWKRLMPNYHLTFSFSGENLDSCLAALAHGVNVAVVFDQVIPSVWRGFQVINGDESDLRFLDPQGVVVGLKAKGPARKMPAGGFIQIGKVT